MELTSKSPGQPSNHEFNSSFSAHKLQFIKEDRILPLDLSETLKTCKMLFLSSLPTSLSNISSLVTSMISLAYVGNYGTSSELAGASVANTWSFVFYYGILNSINIGFQVIASQLFGANKIHELVQTFQKTLSLIAVLSVPLFLLLFLMNNVLATFETDDQVSIMSEIYLIYLIPSLIGGCISDCIRGYMMAQNYFYPQGIIQTIAAALHFLWCHIFVVIFEMPLEGTAIAKGITDILIAFALFIYSQKNGVNVEMPLHWDKSCLEGIVTYLKQTLTIGGNVYVQWMVLGILGFMINALKDEYVIGAHGLASLLLTVIFTIPVGNSLTMQTYLGNAFGAGWKYRAQKVVLSGFSLNLCFSTFNILLIIFGSDFLARLMTNDTITQDIFKVMIHIYAVAHIADTFADHMSAVLRTIGKENEVLYISITCYFIIGIPLQWILGFGLGNGYMGIWWALALQIMLICSVLIRSLVGINWDDLINKVHERIEKEYKGQHNYIEMLEK